MTKFSKIAITSLALVSPFLLALPASAEPLAVTATVVESCSIATTAVAFGSYDPSVTNATVGAPLVGTGAVAVTCTTGSVAHILLGQGANAITGTDAIPARRMVGTPGGAFLTYFLYTDTLHTDVWGNTDATGVDHTGTGASSGDIVVYGSVPGAQNVPAGAYTDTVAATVTF
ncbi:MAG: spore coat U domain-containing protein [Pseudomonadota bacterium]